MIVELADARSGAALEGGRLVFEEPGTLTYAIVGERDVIARVIVDRCALVSFSIRVSGFPDPFPLP